jgi:hypothetical protein
VQVLTFAEGLMKSGVRSYRVNEISQTQS